MGKTVRRVAKPAGRKAATRRSKGVIERQEKDRFLASLSLPTGPKEPDKDFSHYMLLIYGREKAGKTLTFASFPNALFATTEPGTKGLRIHEFNSEHGGITDWDVFRRMVELLVSEAENPTYRTVVVDTADRAYDMCLEWVCANLSIPYPGEDSSGQADYGKSWRAVKDEFLSQIHRLLQAGYGIGFTSHVRETEIKTRSGEKYTRIFPSMSNQARSVIEALVDFFFYAEHAKNTAGENIRILVCEGDEAIWAGARPVDGVTFPRFLPLLKESGYDVIVEVFRGDPVGLDPLTLLPGKQTTKTGREFLGRAKVQGRGRGGGSKKVRKPRR